jgi:hypothetical protein
MQSRRQRCAAACLRAGAVVYGQRNAAQEIGVSQRMVEGTPA